MPWRRFFGLKGGIWYYDSAIPRKTADRPHNLTLLLGLLSPLLALVATSISLVSLRTSREALEIGQRAYLATEVADIVSDPSAVPPEFTSAPNTKGLNVRLKLTVKNEGNTPMAAPGSGSQFVETFKHFEWSHVLSSTASSAYVSALSPHSEVTIETPPHDIFTKPSDGPYDQLVRFTGLLQWQDVFGEKHTETWCYTAWVSDIEKAANTGKPLPTGLCEGYLSLEENPPRGFPHDPHIGKIR